MTNKLSLNPAVLTVHCHICLEQIPEGIMPSEYGRVSVGVTEHGDLVVWCVRHDEPVAMHKQGQIDADLLAIVNEPCAGCGKLHAKEDKERLH